MSKKFILFNIGNVIFQWFSIKSYVKSWKISRLRRKFPYQEKHYEKWTTKKAPLQTNRGFWRGAFLVEILLMWNVNDLVRKHIIYSNCYLVIWFPLPPSSIPRRRGTQKL